jgi:Ras-related GTP-binding protein A/B
LTVWVALIVSQNYSARDTRRLGATIDVEQSAVRFLGSLVLVSSRTNGVSNVPSSYQNLWDCGGQNAFVDNYLTAQKDTIFANVAVLIYVFDITTTEWESDLKYFDEILTALRENSSDAGVWVLINKMDLVDKEDPKRKKYTERKEEILAIDERIRKERGEGEGSLRCFPTSIWDESLYKVGTAIVVDDADRRRGRPSYIRSYRT